MVSVVPLPLERVGGRRQRRTRRGRRRRSKRRRKIRQ
jgi:hypothetical protein